MEYLYSIIVGLVSGIFIFSITLIYLAFRYKMKDLNKIWGTLVYVFWGLLIIASIAVMASLVPSESIHRYISVIPIMISLFIGCCLGNTILNKVFPNRDRSDYEKSLIQGSTGIFSKYMKDHPQNETNKNG